MARSGSSVADVTRVVRPTREALYTGYIDPAIPVVIASDSAQPDKRGLLTPDILRPRFEGKPISVGVADGRTLRPNPEMREIPFDDYAAYVEGAPDDGDLQYAFQIPFDAASDGLNPLLPDAELIRDRLLWFGPSGTVVPMHFDEAHNFFHQHYGRKHVTLVPPNHFESLRPGAKDAPDRHMSSIDLASSDDQSDSARGAPPCLKADLEPGDALFIPAFWWHRVEAVGAAISVTYFWRPPLLSCLHPAFFRLLSSRRVFDDPSTVAQTVELEGGEVNLAVCRLLADLGHAFAAGALAGALVTKYCLTLGQPVVAYQDKGDTSSDVNPAVAARKILDGMMRSGFITSLQNGLLRSCVDLGEKTAAEGAPRLYPVERARGIRALICQLDAEFGDVIKV